MMTQKNMTQSPSFPDVLPLLPMRGVILMPRTLLPVPIFDVTQAAMLAACVQAEKKHIGLVQPNSTLIEGQVLAPLFSTGCLGEIVEFGKTEENNLVVLLKGLCRFDIVEELAPDNGCRTARVTYDSYPGDSAQKLDFSIDRVRLLRSLKSYLASNDMNADWDTLEKASNDQLLNVLSIACPFAVREKQALLETRNPEEQSRVMTALMEMAVLDQNKKNQTCH
ncbi:MAG: LON peptidase substrate-binding domain-containing protein [Alphaproteobacteria bacterium]|jgi:Lon protease-like protein|nr:LON peptidase substrate-binding domain-containing protein [Alphaproteobacteria bacterium]